MNLRATCLLAAGLMLNQGCSLLFVNAPPDALPEKPDQELECTSSVVAPVIDTVIGAYQGVRTGVAISADDSDYADYPISRPVDIAFGLGFTALFIGSAVYGYTTTSKCGDMKDEAALRRVDPSIIPRPETMPAQVACTVDTQCKGDRICEGGRCVSPPPPAPEPAPAAPVPSTPYEPSAPAPAQPAPAQPVPAPLTPPSPSTGAPSTTDATAP